ncbi:TonB-dependent receptor [Stenotrophomonas sp. SY1]|uniref:TonB-dependent receptor n=1 Tax=Stenotrophomonas sp. SY1 TaxID=477235 RepID=UPI001E488A04|nr:TonB-dependent receptor [Stenotrophomonas sp. SY1]MCD9088596.1 TonB-dependent receptor [Stenotrophomonas sp. SY1]
MRDVLYRSVLAVAIVAALGNGNAAHAQSTSSDAVQLDQVSVTAQRREAEMQKTPLSMSVISGPALDRMQIKRVDDIKFTTPNIIIEQNTGTSSGAKIIMRGVGADESMFTNDPAVALYIDDVYIARQNGAMLDLYDVDRIEVLRGPQGTLYGRNATGGAIRYISKKPTGEEKLSFDGSIGNIGRLDGRASFTTRIGETLDVSAAVLSRNRDGIMYDITHNRWVNDQDMLAGRLAFATTWGEASYATLSIDRLRERSTPAWGTPVMLDGNDHVIPKLGSFYKTKSDTLGINDLDQFGVSLTSETDFGSFSWRNILHYRTLEHHFYMDVDGTDQMRYHLEQDQKQNQHGYEAQFTSQLEGPFSWVAGVFTFWEHNDQPTRNDIFTRGGTNYIKQDTSAYAVYAQGDYKFTDKLTLTLGGRYSYENKDFSLRAVRANGTPNFSKQMEKSWNRPDWKALLSYDFSDNVMGYASVTTGFKSGGFNGRGTTYATITPVDAETLRAYEVGVKSTLWDNRLRLNADYYRLDYDGIQLTAVNPDGVFVMTNATGALIQGIEIDAQAQLTSKLRVDASIGTIDGEYQNYADVNAAYFNGRPMKSSPDMQWTLAATYVQPVGNADLVFAAQARHTDEYYQNQDASRLIMTRANTEYNARISYEPREANWSVAVWGKNLSDQFSSTGGFDIANLGVGVIYPNVPRTYGMDFKYRFW